MAAIEKLLKDLFFQALYGFGISRLGRIRGRKFLILTFHRVLPERLLSSYPLPGLAVTPEQLSWIVTILKPHFDVCTVSEGRRRLLNGNGNGNAETPILAITFDDGQLDNFLYAAPVLEECGVAGTFYLPTDFIGTDRLLWHDEVAFAWKRGLLREDGRLRSCLHGEQLNGAGAEDLSVPGILSRLKVCSPGQRREFIGRLLEISAEPVPEWAGLMSWEDAAQLKDRGHEIGSHGRSHELLPQLRPDEQANEIEGSMQVIATKLGGEKPISFCYPNGDHDDSVIALTERAGYENAVTTQWGINSRSRSRFALLRCNMDMRKLNNRKGRPSRARLEVKLSGHQPGQSRS